MAGSNEDFARPRTASGVLYFDETGRVMLVNPTYKPMWDMPGGYVQPGESPVEALRREIAEELGASLPGRVPGARDGVVGRRMRGRQ